MSDVIQVRPVDVEAELDRIAARYRAAGGVGLKLLLALGSRAEGLLDRLPGPVRASLTEATERALTLSLAAARRSRRRVPDQAPWLNTAVSTAMGAAGGFGGLPTALIELPATTTLLMRAIQGVAEEYDFDAESETVQFDCLRVFAAAGPLERDDGIDLSFVTMRLTLTGGTMQRLVGAVAPRLATVLGHKLAAQSVPLLGALTGATTNYLFASYYQEMAHVHFGLRRLAINADIPESDLVERLRGRMLSRRSR